MSMHCRFCLSVQFFINSLFRQYPKQMFGFRTQVYNNCIYYQMTMAAYYYHELIMSEGYDSSEFKHLILGSTLFWAFNSHPFLEQKIIPLLQPQQSCRPISLIKATQGLEAPRIKEKNLPKDRLQNLMETRSISVTCRYAAREMNEHYNLSNQHCIMLKFSEM